MASKATHPHAGRRARVLHLLVPSRRRTAVLLAVDAVAVGLGVPLPLHVLNAVVAHVVVAFVS